MNIVDIKIINNDILLSRLKALRLCKGLLLYTHTYKCNIIKIDICIVFDEVFVMGLILDIYEIMHQLSIWRPIFHSEADFQFSLAWLIKKKYPECEIRLEFVPEFNPSLHLDILVILNGKWIPIELKYTTRKCIKTINDEVYVLKEQGAKDQGCYNYLKDIMRIEEFRNKSNNFIEGYTIKITSEISYLKPPTKVNCTYAEFSIEDGSIKTGCMNWAANTGKGTMRGMEAPIELTGIYPINWKEYSKVDDNNSGTFMYLVNRISK